MKISKYTFVLLICFFYCQLSFSQESINSTGGDIKNDGGTVSYSIGQIFFTEDQGIGVAQKGVQQPYFISDVLNVDNKKNVAQLKLYPNPTKNAIFLDVQESKVFCYQLYSIDGVSIKYGKIRNQQTEISMNELPSGVYILIISDKDNLPLKSFKIIKN